MPTEIMRRTATENVYHHPDFHGALSCGLEYLQDHYGPESVKDYLRDFVTAFYAPLKKELQTRGLEALREHFTKLYNDEGGDARITLNADVLLIEVAACPAVMHMRRKNYPVARMWSETTRTVNEVLCDGTAYAADLVSYDEATGRSVQRFFRRPA
jgi:hypothetical protein